MSTTTDILFNSPALHALKRTQLVQLCKRHNIKANGKNAELIERLKQHASSLNLEVENGGIGQDHALSDSDEENVGVDRPQRPSEMWEIVMDAIPEEDGSSSNQGSLSSKKSTATLNAGTDFGTNGSSKSTVTSSIRAFASSLGLKRTLTASESGTLTSTSSRKALSTLNVQQQGTSMKARDSLLANAIPYGSLPASSSLPLQTEPFAFSYTPHDTSITINEPNDGDTSMVSLDRPIPGTGIRCGVEVDGLGAMSGAGTIRLISNTSVNNQSQVAGYDSPPKLTPFQPSFDLVPPTPGGLNAMKWPKTPGPSRVGNVADTKDGMEERKGIYPSLGNAEDDSMEMPGGLGGSPSAAVKATLSPSRNDVFVFGSPNANKSKTEFSQAASSVLAEMNARLALAGVQPLSLDILARAGKSNMTEDEILNYKFEGASGRTSSNNRTDEGSVRLKFDRAHEQVFAKMEGIDAKYASRREKLEPLPQNRKRKSNVLAEYSQPRRPSVAPMRRSSNARVISAGTRKKLGMGLPGAFGDEDEDDNDESREEPVARKRARPSIAPGQKRVSIATKPSNKDDSDDEDEDEERKRKEREAIKRKLEMQKARRRSSRGRPSMGGPRTSLANQKKFPPKGTTSRFGFLSSAKSLVKSVWNRGAGAPTPAVPVPKPAAVSKIANSTSAAKATSVSKSTTMVSTTSSLKPAVPSTKKPAFIGVGSGTGSRPSTSSRVSTARMNRVSSSGVLHANMKSGTATSSTSFMSKASTGTAGPRSRSPLPTFDGSEESEIKKGSTSSRMSNTTAVDSRGNRRSVAPPIQPKKARPSSTLLAPTASSLAKMNTNAVRRPLPIPPTGPGSSVTSPTLAASPSKIPVILPLSPRKKSAPLSPTSGERKSIFTTPLVLHNDHSSTVNPITGQPSPSRIPLASSGITNQNIDNGSLRRGLSVTRKPRISRSKIIAKLGQQRAASSTSNAELKTSNSGPVATLEPNAVGSGSRKVRPRSSIGTGRTRSSMGAGRNGVKAAGGLSSARGSGVGVGAGGMLIGAKRRARASEFARRRSARPAVNSGGDEDMDVDA